MTDWKPISLTELQEIIDNCYSKMSLEQRSYWESIAIKPIKWDADEYGKEREGFWVVGMISNRVIWYNDIEEGFNISKYSKVGKIDEYEAEQDELSWALNKLKIILQQRL